jgi:lysophospholipase L1-like esterase
MKKNRELRTYRSFNSKHPYLLFLCSLIFLSCSWQVSILNKGIGGNNTNDLLKRIERDVLAQKPDLVILMAGTNDMINSQKLISYNQFEQNFRLITDALNASKIPIVIMSPPPVDTGYLFKRHDRNLYDQDPNLRIDSIRSILRELATSQNIGFIDINSLFRRKGSPSREASSLIVNSANMGIEDGVHPTREGYYLIAKEVYSYLKDHDLLKRKQKILCFGDSMTFGAFMKGQGTAGGETYPGFLKRFIERKGDF